MELQTELRTGDIVHLNSGSPDMKVVSIDGEKILVEWGDASNPQQYEFYRPSLRLVSREDHSRDGEVARDFLLRQDQ